MTSVAGKRVLITGAASGLGKGLAEKMAKRGAVLILWDFNQQALDECAEDFKSQGLAPYCYCVDVTDREAIREAAEQVINDTGGIDILVNNAGIVSGKGILDASEEDIVRTFDVNTLALFWTTRAFMPGMVERNEGHIVTVASAAGIAGTAKLVDYCASKFAAFGFDEALRLEIEREQYDIRTTVICPFFINTGMFDGVKTRFPVILPILKPDYVIDQMLQAIEKNKPRLIMPKFVSVTFIARLLPVKIFDRLQSLLGISSSMDEFKGRGA